MLALFLPAPSVVLPRPMVTPRATITRMAEQSSCWGASTAAETWGVSKVEDVAGRSAAVRAAQRRSNASPEVVPKATQARTASERAAQRAAGGADHNASPTAVPSATQARTAVERAAERAARSVEPKASPMAPRVAQPRTATHRAAQRAAGLVDKPAAKMQTVAQSRPGRTDGALSKMAERSKRVADKSQRLAESLLTSPLAAAQMAARSKGVVVPTGRASSSAAPAAAPTLAAIVARSKTDPEEAARAWLAKLSVPSWGEAAAELSKAAAEAAAMVLLAEQGESGDDAACAVLHNKEAAWLAKMGAPPWAEAAPAAAAVPDLLVGGGAGMQAVLRKLDATRWGQVAAALSQAAATADVMVALTEECDEGCPISCDLLLAEKAGAGDANVARGAKPSPEASLAA